MAERSVKGIRMSAETQRLLKLLSALEDRPEGDIAEDALLGYLQMRSINLTGSLDEARALANASPDDVGEIVTGLVDAMETALANGQLPATGKDRLREQLGATTA